MHHFSVVCNNLFQFMLSQVYSISLSDDSFELPSWGLLAFYLHFHFFAPARRPLFYSFHFYSCDTLFFKSAYICQATRRPCHKNPLVLHIVLIADGEKWVRPVFVLKSRPSDLESEYSMTIIRRTRPCRSRATAFLRNRDWLFYYHKCLRCLSLEFNRKEPPLLPPQTTINPWKWISMTGIPYDFCWIFARKPI